MLTDILLKIIEETEKVLTLTDEIIIDNLPEDGGISFEADGGSVGFIDFGKTYNRNPEVMIKRKSKNQRECIDDIDNIINYLVGLRSYWCVDGIKISNIIRIGDTQKVSLKNDDYYIYVGVIQVMLYG